MIKVALPVCLAKAFLCPTALHPTAAHMVAKFICRSFHPLSASPQFLFERNFFKASNEPRASARARALHCIARIRDTERPVWFPSAGTRIL